MLILSLYAVYSLQNLERKKKKNNRAGEKSIYVAISPITKEGVPFEPQ